MIKKLLDNLGLVQDKALVLYDPEICIGYSEREANFWAIYKKMINITTRN